MEEKYIPALKYRWLTGLYDPVVRLTTRENTFKRLLLQSAQITGKERILDLACGTGTLAKLLKEAQPQTDIYGVDADAEILQIARNKMASLGLAIDLRQGRAEALPYDNESFDRAFSSLFFHHLTPKGKAAAFKELHRVLKSGAWLHVADWGKAENSLMRVLFFGIQFLDGFSTTQENVEGRIPAYLSEAGFVDVSTRLNVSTVFGTISIYTARKY